MPESRLTADFYELAGEVAVFLGFGRGPTFGDAEFTTRQQQVLDSCIKAGLRNVYFPAALPGETVPHDWSFLRPVATLALASGGQTIPLPDDYGGIDGPITVSATSATTAPWLIETRMESQIRRMYSQTPSVTGPPAYMGEQPIKGTTPASGQRFQLICFPAADQDYTVQVAYDILPDYLSGALPYLYGGSAHTETFLESCKAMAEQTVDDMLGIHSLKFKERLQASVAHDRKHKAQQLGYCGDRSDMRRGMGWPDRHYLGSVCTYNNQSFD